MNSVIFRDQERFSVDGAALASLKAAALESPKKRARICLHAAHEDPIQQMLIALVRGYPVGPLRQNVGQKTYCAVEGTLLVTFYDDDGRAQEQTRISATGPGPRVITFPASSWQSCEAETETAIYLEIQPGPFDPAQTQWRSQA